MGHVHHAFRISKTTSLPALGERCAVPHLGFIHANISKPHLSDHRGSLLAWTAPLAPPRASVGHAAFTGRSARLAQVEKSPGQPHAGGARRGAGVRTARTCQAPQDASSPSHGLDGKRSAGVRRHLP